MIHFQSHVHEDVPEGFAEGVMAAQPRSDSLSWRPVAKHADVVDPIDTQLGGSTSFVPACSAEFASLS